MKTSISFSGIDGAGKSTQIKNLINFLGSENCKFHRLKFGYTPGVELLKKIFIFFWRDTSRSIDLVKNKDFRADVWNHKFEVIKLFKGDPKPKEFN